MQSKPSDLRSLASLHLPLCAIGLPPFLRPARSLCAQENPKGEVSQVMGTRYHFGWAVTFRFVPGVARSGYARRGADSLRK